MSCDQCPSLFLAKSHVNQCNPLGAWLQLDYLMALQCQSLSRCSQEGVNLLHHHPPPPPHAPHCLRGARKALSPGEGSSDLQALCASAGGTDNTNGNVTTEKKTKKKKKNPTKEKGSKMQQVGKEIIKQVCPLPAVPAGVGK